ncbi:hypothetical protein [Acinetobacter stercoris]|uniref:DUF5071 domain-containing protein n=1 Tax=Acinetobacter stercoris TaxID=2126983 RepID=A0A2U3MYM0_9GAMM|nr:MULTISPECIES: hypothetical protein [Acinetobacter]SPL70453.1 hypothetical protein KPC_1631 [Acinetobacter stercoris]
MTGNDIVEIKRLLDEDSLYIHSLIDLAFVIKKKLKDKSLEFSSLIEPKSGHQWENIAMMLPYLSKKLIEENIDRLLEGFMDLNWQGSRVLYAYLAEMDIEILKPAFSRTIDQAIKINDSEWVYFLLIFMKDERIDLSHCFDAEIQDCLKYLQDRGIEF